MGLRRVSGNYFPKVSGSTTNLVVLSPLSLRRFSSEVKRKAKTAKIMLDGCLFRNCRMRMIATNYIEIYIVRGYDEKIGREYAILAVLCRSLITNRLSQKEDIRGCEKNNPRRERCLTEGRNRVFRASRHGLSRCD